MASMLNAVQIETVPDSEILSSVVLPVLLLPCCGSQTSLIERPD